MIVPALMPLRAFGFNPTYWVEFDHPEDLFGTISVCIATVVLLWIMTKALQRVFRLAVKEKD